MYDLHLTYVSHLDTFIKLGISIPMSLMYGYDIESIHDPVIEAAEKSVSLAAPLLAPGGSIINVFPILGKIPPWFPT
jgi:hypothetical protein